MSYMSNRTATRFLMAALLVLVSVYTLSETSYAEKYLAVFYRSLSAHLVDSASSTTACGQWKEMKQGRQEKHHIVFLKVHKTGSSTVQNIFLRFGYKRNLTFVLGHDDNHLAETKGLPSMISFQNTLNNKNIVPPPPGRHYDVLCCHVIYNRGQFEKYMPQDSVYIGIVRDPITRLESAFEFFELFRNVDLGDYAVNPLKYEKTFPSMSNNRMAFEYGFPRNLFPGSKIKPGNVTREIASYIEKVRSEFDLILINERLEESLVMMKRLLNWHTKDITFMSQFVRNKSRRFSKKHATALKSFLYLDYALYNATLKEFQTKVDSLGKDFTEEVHHFGEIRTKLLTFCNTTRFDSKLFEASKWECAFTITRSECELYKKSEIDFIQKIRKQQYGRLGI